MKMKQREATQVTDALIEGEKYRQKLIKKQEYKLWHDKNRLDTITQKQESAEQAVQKRTENLVNLKAATASDYVTKAATLKRDKRRMFSVVTLTAFLFVATVVMFFISPPVALVLLNALISYLLFLMLRAEIAEGGKDEYYITNIIGVGMAPAAFSLAIGVFSYGVTEGNDFRLYVLPLILTGAFIGYTLFPFICKLIRSKRERKAELKQAVLDQINNR